MQPPFVIEAEGDPIDTPGPSLSLFVVQVRPFLDPINPDRDQTITRRRPLDGFNAEREAGNDGRLAATGRHHRYLREIIFAFTFAEERQSGPIRRPARRPVTRPMGELPLGFPIPEPDRSVVPVVVKVDS